MYDHAPILLHRDEQLVHAVHARILPTMTEVIAVLLVAPLALIIALFFHRAFRSATYVITTRRVLVVDKQGVCGEIDVADIQRLRTGRGRMMIYSGASRLWLPRLQDAWHFEAVLEKVQRPN